MYPIAANQEHGGPRRDYGAPIGSGSMPLRLSGMTLIERITAAAALNESAKPTRR
jgi:hypothetical protein